MIISFLIIPIESSAQATQKQKASKAFALKVAQKYCSNAYEIIESDNAKSVAFWMDNQSSGLMDPTGFGSTVHECLHAYDHTITSELRAREANGIRKRGYFIDKGIKIIVPEFTVFKTDELHPKHIPTGIQGAGRYRTYVTGTASSNDKGLFGLMEEFNAYYHDNQAVYEMMIKGQKLMFNGEVSENITTNNVSSYYEFNIFMACYLKYAKKYEAETYSKLIKNRSLRLAYTLIEKNWRDLLTRIYSNSEIGDHFPCKNHENALFNSELRKIMSDFMLPLNDVKMKPYYTYAKAKKYKHEVVERARSQCDEVDAIKPTSNSTLADGEEIIVEKDDWTMPGDDENRDRESSFSVNASSKQSDYYYVVVGSTSDFGKAAQAYASKYQKNYAQSGIYIQDDARYVIYLYKYKDKSRANEKAASLRTKYPKIQVR